MTSTTLPAGIAHACVAALLVIVSFASVACAQRPDERIQGNSDYAFSRPDAKFELDRELEEISGLALIDEDHVAAVQDEDGYVYVLRLRDGEIERRITFAGRGDYEGIEIVDGTIYVLESRGELYRVTNWEGEEEPETETIELDLPKNCDAEGLGFERRANRLLIPCKDYPGKGLSQSKAVYAYDLSDGRVQTDPAYVIESDSVAAAFRDHPVNEAVRGVLSERFDLSGFRPAAVAVHPLTEEVFVVSSVRKVLVALDTSGRIARIWPLPEAEFPQPEGLAFLPNGDLLISSEAGGGSRGTLHRFNYQAAAE